VFIIIAISGIESNAKLARKRVKQGKKGRWDCVIGLIRMSLPTKLSQKIAPHTPLTAGYFTKTKQSPGYISLAELLSGVGVAAGSVVRPGAI
jgi:hypothetical protein